MERPSASTLLALPTMTIIFVRIPDGHEREDTFARHDRRDRKGNTAHDEQEQEQILVPTCSGMPQGLTLDALIGCLDVDRSCQSGARFEQRSRALTSNDNDDDRNKSGYQARPNPVINNDPWLPGLRRGYEIRPLKISHQYTASTPASAIVHNAKGITVESLTDMIWRTTSQHTTESESELIRAIETALYSVKDTPHIEAQLEDKVRIALIGYNVCHFFYPVSEWHHRLIDGADAKSERALEMPSFPGQSIKHPNGLDGPRPNRRT